MNFNFLLESFIAQTAAAIVGGLIVWAIVSRFGRRRERQHRQQPDDKPLTVSYDNDLPFGYYKLSEGRAKLMDPEFYRRLKTYGERAMIVWIISCLLCLIGLISLFSELNGHASETATAMVVLGGLLGLVLAPWWNSKR